MDITTLIQQAIPLIPFRNKNQAQIFLNSYIPDDQLALISALYIGRDHIHQQTLLNGYQNANRQTHNHISAVDFAQILVDKHDAARGYFDSFLRCGGTVPGFLGNF